ncbi:NAD(P)/FAD-dependent oxidoreductase [Streptomyces sp. NBRC 109706]|uniref:NAD(P)/FAD-dependent oxidoreductase n=1 Tax=Streptomyces sp. NBRC 109706 TaxID=1550035 RepID=UPI00082F919C|nr:NAD(P)/FAD-dependent oxidoreductase [Streptomyces sp. NBRC 109706]
MTELDVAVIGAGIAGLAAADRLRRAGRSVRVFEATDRIGGRMRTSRHEGYLVDEGAETLGTHGYPNTWELIRDLGIDTEAVLPVTASVGIWRDRRVHPRVGHPLGGITGAGLSVPGRMRMGRMIGKLLRRARKFDVDHPESTPLGATTVAEFAADYPQELYDYLFQPAVGTAFGWQPDRVAMGPFVASMISTRGIWKWRTYRDGMDSLARAIAETVPVETERPVAEIVVDGDRGVRVGFLDGATLHARQVVLAVPAPLARQLYPTMPAAEAAYADACDYAPMIRVSCLLDRPLEPARGRRQPRVHALLLPHREEDVLGGLTVEHNKAGNRAPAGRGVITLLPSTKVTAELLQESDEKIAGTLLERAETYVPGIGAACHTTLVHRFPQGAVEPSPRALAARPAFAARPAGPVEYAGDWVFLRASSEGAVRSGTHAAARVLSRPGTSGGQAPVAAHPSPPHRAT